MKVCWLRLDTLFSRQGRREEGEDEEETEGDEGGPSPSQSGGRQKEDEDNEAAGAGVGEEDFELVGPRRRSALTTTTTTTSKSFSPQPQDIKVRVLRSGKSAGTASPHPLQSRQKASSASKRTLTSNNSNNKDKETTTTTTTIKGGRNNSSCGRDSNSGLKLDSLNNWRKGEMGAIKCGSNCDSGCANKESSIKMKNQVNSFSNSASLSPCTKCVLGCNVGGLDHCSDGGAGKKSRVYSYDDAPSYLRFNPYITGGYRTALTPWECVKSLFWWNNESLNIWSHLLGWLFFLGLSVYDAFGLLNLPTTHPYDQLIITLMLISFQACMLLSALYHVFCCCSERYYRRWLSADLFGVSLSLLAIYISGIYYAFSCVPFWLNFYLITVGAIFLSAMIMQIIPIVKKPTTEEAFHWRLVVFGGWAAYGFIPTGHWALLHGGMSSPIVALMLPRIGLMYVISIAAFFFYVFRVPEKLFPGLVNFIGSSHQIWHILIVVALYHWHNTGLVYLHYRSKAENSCENEYAFLFPTSVEPPLVEA